MIALCVNLVVHRHTSNILKLGYGGLERKESNKEVQRKTNNYSNIPVLSHSYLIIIIILFLKKEALNYYCMQHVKMDSSIS